MKPETDNVTAPPLKKEGWLRPAWIYQGKKYKTFEEAITVRQHSLKQNGLDPLDYPLSDNSLVTIENLVFDPLYGSPWLIRGNEIIKQRTFAEENGKTLTLQIQYSLTGGEVVKFEHLGVKVNPALGFPDKTLLFGKFQTCSGSLTSDLIIVNTLKFEEEDATLLWFDPKREGPIRTCSNVFETGKDFNFQLFDTEENIVMQYPFINDSKFKELKLLLKG